MHSTEKRCQLGRRAGVLGWNLELPRSRLMGKDRALDLIRGATRGCYASVAYMATGYRYEAREGAVSLWPSSSKHLGSSDRRRHGGLKLLGTSVSASCLARRRRWTVSSGEGE